MPTMIELLENSAFMANATGAVFKAAFRLWMASWQGRGAGGITSRLPNDDRVLANIAGYGGDLTRWRQMKAAVMHGYILCSDGFWYHVTQARIAIEMMEKRVRDKNRKREEAGQAPDARDLRAGLAQELPKTSEVLGKELPKTSQKVRTSDEENQWVNPDFPNSVRANCNLNYKGTPSPIGEGATAGAAAPAAPQAGSAPEQPQEPPPKPTQEKLFTDAVDEADALRREAWEEGKGIVARLAPSQDPGERSRLLNTLVAAHGGGVEGGMAAMDVLRTMRIMAATRKLPGYAMAETDDERTKAVTDYLWKIINNLKAEQKGDKSGPARRGRDGKSRRDEPGIAEDFWDTVGQRKEAC